MGLRLKTKAIAMIVAMLVLFFGATMVVNDRLMRGQLLDGKTAEIEASFERFRKEIDTFTDNQGTKADNLAQLGAWVHQLERQSPELDAAEAAMQLALSQLRTASDEAILGGGIWYEPFALEADRRWVGAYAVVSGPGEAKPTWEYSTDAYAYSTHAWYTIAVPSEWDRSQPRVRDLYMTEPYMDSLDGRPTVFITFTQVMYDDARRIIGVSTADWTFDSLAQTLDQFKVTKSSFAFLVHEPSHKVLYPVERDELTQVSDAPWGEYVDFDALRGDDLVRVSAVDVGGHSYDVLYGRTRAGFVFGHFVARDEAYAAVHEMTRRSLWIALIALLLAVLVTYYIVGRLIGPIHQLAASARRIAGGDIAHEARVETGDEIGELARAFNLAHRHMRANANAVEEAADKLRVSERHFRQLIENATDIITVVDERGIITYTSPSVRRVLGASPDDLVGTQIAQLIHPDDVDRARGAIERLHSGATPVDSVELRMRRADHSWRAFEAIGTRADDGVVLNARDVTERKEAEQALRHTESQLRQAAKLEAVGRLAGGVAHDFNNAMTAVLGVTELLLRRRRDDADLVARLGEIKAAGEHAAGLTRQLLTFSRNHVSERSPVDLNEAVHSVKSMLRHLIGADVELITELGDELPSVVADARELEQVLVNLVVNARDAVNSGGRIIVRTSLESVGAPLMSVNGSVEPGEYCALSVIDDGSGMDARTLARIFDPFFTTKEQERGTGLGLSTVYGIAKDSGGFILVDSEPGGGTQFQIYWPPAATASTRDALAARDEVRGGSETVLVVEDEARVRRVTTELLRDAGYTVLEARDGTEALKVARKHRIDALVTDVVMPRMTGPQLVEELAAVLPDLPVVFVSGYVAGELPADSLASPTHAYLQKPYEPDRLIEVVRGVLDAAAGARQDASDEDDDAVDQRP